MFQCNSLAPGKFERNMKYVIFKRIFFSDWWLRYLLWSCPNMNVTGLYWWSVNIGSGNGLVPSGNKPLPEPMLTQISVAIWRTRPRWVKGYLSCYFTGTGAIRWFPLCQWSNPEEYEWMQSQEYTPQHHVCILWDMVYTENEPHCVSNHFYCVLVTHAGAIGEDRLVNAKWPGHWYHLNNQRGEKKLIEKRGRLFVIYNDGSVWENGSNWRNKEREIGKN